MLHITHEILTYYPYRITCDKCAWRSGTYAKLSQVSAVMTAHLRTSHAPVNVHKPAPTKPSLVLVK